MNQPPLFDIDEVSGAAIAPPPKIFEISGETDERVGQLQDDVVAWTFEGGVWWITDTAGGITGYNLAKFVWLSITPKVD